MPSQHALSVIENFEPKILVDLTSLLKETSTESTYISPQLKPLKYLKNLLTKVSCDDLPYIESSLLRVFARILLGKTKRDYLFNLRRFRPLFDGFTPINRMEAFCFWEGFRCIFPIDVPSILQEVRTVYLKPSKNDVVIDAGAHYGFYTLYASTLVSEKGIILSFEPHPRNYKGLFVNTRCLNKIGNAKIFNMALGDLDGQTRLYFGKYHSGSHSIVFRDSGKYIDVLLVKIDTVVKKLGLTKLDLIKIDTEGAELHILKGAKESVKRFKPNLTIAAYHFPQEVAQLKEILQEMNPHYNFQTVGGILHAIDQSRMDNTAPIDLVYPYSLEHLIENSN